MGQQLSAQQEEVSIWPSDAPVHHRSTVTSTTTPADSNEPPAPHLSTQTAGSADDQHCAVVAFAAPAYHRDEHTR
jgi:hypothetical protein